MGNDKFEKGGIVPPLSQRGVRGDLRNLKTLLKVA